MDDDTGARRRFSVRTFHGTHLLADPAHGKLCHGHAGAALPVAGRVLGRDVLLLARMDGGPIRYPGQDQPWAALPLMLVPQPDTGSVALRVPGGQSLTATPQGGMEANRTAIGGWEQFVLEPATGEPRPFRLITQGAVSPAVWSDPAVDPGVVAGLLASQSEPGLRAAMPVVSQREDYPQLFPFVRTMLSAAEERSRYDTRAHLRAGIEAHGWVVGDHTYGTPTVVDGQYGTVRIGRYCSIAGEVRIVAANHMTDTVTTYPFAALSRYWPSARPDAPDHAGRGVTIGNSVWIGAGATILPGARIGDGAIIGAMAVVAGTVPPYAVAVGNPARVTRQRFNEDTVRRLLDVRWWDWPDHRVDRAIPLLLGTDIQAFLAMAEA